MLNALGAKYGERDEFDPLASRFSEEVIMFLGSTERHRAVLDWIPKSPAAVFLTKRVKTPNGLRYCPVVLAASGRAKPDYVYVDSNEDRHTEGAYYIEWRENGKRENARGAKARLFGGLAMIAKSKTHKHCILHR